MNDLRASAQNVNPHHDLKDELQKHDGMSVERNCQLSLTLIRYQKAILDIEAIPLPDKKIKGHFL